MSHPPVPRAGRLTPEAFERDHLFAGRPVVMTGALEGWKALSLWTPEYLESRLGTRQVAVSVSDDATFAYDADAAEAYGREQMSFAQAAALVSGRTPSPRRYYLMEQSIPQVFPELVGDYIVPPYIGSHRAKHNFWLGAAGNVTPLHFDTANTLFAQIYGRKRFLLYPPEQTEVLYPFPATARHAHMSLVDVERPDLERFPRFPEASPLECEVGPGDLLYLPAFWWHHVRSLTLGISVSFWWGLTLAQFCLPQGRRLLPVFYERDRLLSMKSALIDAGDHDGYLGMARYVLEREAAGTAVLFAGAAFEEAVRALFKRSVSAADLTAYRDLSRMLRELTRAGVFGDAETEQTKAWSELIARAKADPDSIARAEAARFIEGAAGFAARHATR